MEHLPPTATAPARGPLLPLNCRSPGPPKSPLLLNQGPRPQHPPEATMNASAFNPNHRILIVDDNPAIHDDFRKILCPARPGRSEVQDLKTALFDAVPKIEAPTDIELVSAFQGQEALELAKKAAAEGRPF